MTFISRESVVFRSDCAEALADLELHCPQMAFLPAMMRVNIVLFSLSTITFTHPTEEAGDKASLGMDV